MSSEPVIAAEGLGKCYHIYAEPADRLKQMIIGPRRKLYTEFWALRDVSFEVRAGETVGFLGQNGAGKSTLLQLVCGTLSPSAGRVRVAGRISALLELGVGFNPEFTGLENVFLYGALLGLTRSEMEARLDKILAFADIGEFVRLPVKTYSSGMLVRLAFSVAVNVDPRVLIVDEALAVGDARFAARCLRMINALRDGGATILFVSHDSDAVRRFCTRAFVLDRGSIITKGNPVDVVNWYHAFAAADYDRQRTPDFVERAAPKLAPPQAPDSATNERREIANLTRANSTGTPGRIWRDATFSAPEAKLFRYGDQCASIKACSLLNAGGAPIDAAALGEQVTFAIDIEFHEEVGEHGVGFYVDDRLGAHVIGLNTFQENVPAMKASAGDRLRYEFTFSLHIRPGSYTISPSIAYNQTDAKWMDYIENVIVFQVVDETPNRIVFGSYLPPVRKVAVARIGAASAEDNAA
jgi:lipopolysaccharide transport system ATP-binding protein